MSYSEAMEAAGAIIHEFAEFGSYQGDWWAKVTYNGYTGWVNGSYGSCSGCDAFEREFGWREEYCNNHLYNPKDATGCIDCEKAARIYQKKLADFGRRYLDVLCTQEEAIKNASRDIDWDMDAQEMVDFIKSH